MHTRFELVINLEVGIIRIMLGGRNKTFQFGDPVTTPVTNQHCGSAPCVVLVFVQSYTIYSK